jgi:hypothetical protein
VAAEDVHEEHRSLLLGDRQALEARRLDPVGDRPEGPARDADSNGALLRLDRERRQARDAAPAARRRAAAAHPAAGGAAPHPAAPAAQQINIDPAALDVVRHGLYDATHASYGTATAVFGGFPIPVAGKTGTAEKAVDPGDGIMRLFDQSWWCGYGPADDPRLVVCAVIENGGHGGTAAAPAALKVFEEFFHQKAPALGAIYSD